MKSEAPSRSSNQSFKDRRKVHVLREFCDEQFKKRHAAERVFNHYMVRYASRTCMMIDTITRTNNDTDPIRDVQKGHAGRRRSDGVSEVLRLPRTVIDGGSDMSRQRTQMASKKPYIPNMNS